MQEQSDARLAREEAERALSKLREDAARDYAAARSVMAGDLRQLTALLEAKINAWDNALDRAECRMLAQSYAALHSLSETALDKLALTAAVAQAARRSGVARI